MSRTFRWTCSNDGCYVEKKIAKLYLFDDLFPRGCGFGDVDGLLELEGHGLFLETKSVESIPRGQAITAGNLSRTGPLSFWFIVGDLATEEMKISKIKVCKRGRWGLWEASSLENLRDRMQQWRSYVEANPAPSLYPDLTFVAAA